MNSFKSLLVKGLGVRDAESIAAECVKSKKNFQSIIEIVREGETTPTMKASWVLAKAVEIKPELVQEFSAELLQLLLDEKQSNVQRELIKVVMPLKLSDEEEGRFLDLCFRLVMKADSDIAVKYNGLLVIEKSLKKYPDLTDEYLLALESSYEGFTDAGKRYLKKRIERYRK